jgi:hypothetical protein
MNVKYKLGGVDLATYGVHVSASDGLLSKPQPKRAISMSWQEYHGEVVDLSKRTYEPRDIELDCFINAESQWEFQDKVNTFLAALDGSETKRLEVSVDELSGGENLILNSKLNIIDSNQYLISTIQLSEDVVINADYVFVAKAANNAGRLLQIWGNDGGLFIAQGPIQNGVCIIKFKGVDLQAGKKRTLRIYKSSSEFVSLTSIDYVKLEKGIEASEYTPAPEDLKPLLFEVYSSEGVDIKKTWSERNMVGTFKLKLREPEPVKRVIKYTRMSDANKTASITVTSSKLLNVYWGDGSHTYDVSGTAQTITHDFTADGDYYIVITGNIDEINSLTTNGTVIWNKL